MVTWRFETTGGLDTTFNGQGWVVHDSAAGGNSIDTGFGAATDALGRIVVTGQSLDAGGNAYMAIRRYR